MSFDVTFVLYEKDGQDRKEALTYWSDTHGPIASKIPGVRSYVQQHAVGAPEGDPPFLGVATLAFDDEAAFGTAGASAEMATALADLENFCSPQMTTAFTRSVTIV